MKGGLMGILIFVVGVLIVIWLNHKFLHVGG